MNSVISRNCKALVLICQELNLFEGSTNIIQIIIENSCKY